MIIVPMNESHVRAIRPQTAQSDEAQDAEARAENARRLMSQGACWAVIDEDGVVALAGVAEQWDGRALAWCLLSDHAHSRMLSLTRAVRRYLDGLNYRRLEMYVDASFTAGCRWAEMLGFRNETPEGMRGFMPNGNAAFMYGRVK